MLEIATNNVEFSRAERNHLTTIIGNDISGQEVGLKGSKVIGMIPPINNIANHSKTGNVSH